jgi:hypothetical protein
MATWSTLTFQPTPDAIAALRAHWAWQLGDDWEPLMFSVIGDVFLEQREGTIWWLSTAMGTLERVAESRDAFHQHLDTERADEWFLPGLVDVLHDQGQVPGPGQCYAYAILPVFAEGSFSAENMHPADARAYFASTGDIHRKIRDLKDGDRVPLEIV